MKAKTAARLMAWGIVAFAFAATMFTCGAAAALDMQDGSLSKTDWNLGKVAELLFSFDGSTSAFGIPAGLRGSISAGQEVYEMNCAACHSNAFVLPPTTFQGFQRRMNTGAMDGIELSDQEIADIVAWLNRYHPDAQMAMASLPAVN